MPVSQLGKFQAIIFLKYFFPILFNLFFGDLSYVHINHFDIIPQNPEAVSLFSVFKFTDFFYF